MQFSFHPIDDFKAIPPLMKGIIITGTLLVVALSAIGVASLWLSTGSALPIGALGAFGTIGLASLLTTTALGTAILIAIALLCLCSITKKSKAVLDIGIEEREAWEVAEKENKKVLDLAKPIDRQDNIIQELRRIGCIGFQKIEQQTNKIPIAFSIDINEVLAQSYLGIGDLILIENKTEISKKPLSKGNYIMQKGTIEGGGGSDESVQVTHFIYQNKLGIYYICLYEQKNLSDVTEHIINLSHI